jgi:hypothetical protein
VQVNHDNLELLIAGRNIVNLIPKDGVRHVDDPKAQTLRDQTVASGVWEALSEAQDGDEKVIQREEDARKREEDDRKAKQKQLAGAK